MLSFKKKQYSFWFKNGLILVFLFLFVISLIGQTFNGWKEFNDFLGEYNQPSITYSSYLISGHFIQATFENWESEFLQMALFVIFTIFLRQKGSSESKSCEEPIVEPSELKPHSDSPWPVKKGGIWLALYKHSLSISLLLLYILSFILHWYGSWLNYNLEQKLNQKSLETFLQYGSSSRLWFESFQNWQSEFLSVFAIVFLSIYLRQMGSSQSKKVNAAHSETGE
ncbi:MAG: hypothetical protein K0R51_1021 [Cytophagaceae bacterium]|jgi:hypothetical protein|nr:hypothetical protein [Cytophagaceae bacterium]